MTDMGLVLAQGSSQLAFNETVIDTGLLSMHPIKAFLNYKKAENTQSGYEQDILSVFNMIFADSVEDVESITKTQIEAVSTPVAHSIHDQLINNGRYAEATIARKIGTMKSLYKFLITVYASNRTKQQWIFTNPWESIEASVSEVDGYGHLERHEVELLLEVANKEDATLYELAVTTGVRLSALLKLNINTSFIKIDGVWCITGIDKGKKKFEDAINNELYEACRELADVRSGKVFNVTRQTVLNRLKGRKDRGTKGYLHQIGLTDEEIEQRDLCFHSFKKSAVTFTGDLTNGDIRAMAKAGHHTNTAYTLGVYDKSQDKKYNSVGLRMNFNSSADKANERLQEKLESMTKDELVALIMGLKPAEKQAIAYQV